MSASLNPEQLLQAAARKREQAKRCHDLLIDLDNSQAIIILGLYARELEDAARALETQARELEKTAA
jgi:hypothetical protein